ncbi:hypothetical protein MLD59_23215 [Verrucomicrobiaceae bacterium E54]|nr:hypothetical protein [Verrucomicrobiaceae bacterium E54]
MQTGQLPQLASHFELMAVGVEVHGQPDIPVPHEFLSDSRHHARSGQERGKGPPERMKFELPAPIIEFRDARQG